MKARLPGEIGNNMADQGNSKEVCYLDDGFRRTVLQEYHHSSTRKHENYREKSPRNAMRTLAANTSRGTTR